MHCADEFEDERTDSGQERDDRRAGCGVKRLLKSGGCGTRRLVMNTIAEMHFDHAFQLRNVHAGVG